MTAQEIWEECICDSLGDMNVFTRKDKNTATFMQEMLPEIKAAASESKSPTQTRGSPDAKASRETYSKHDKALYSAGVSFLHKNFPPENERLSEAHRLAVWWARRSDIVAGDQTIIVMNDVHYLVECFDDALNYYQVEEVISNEDFDIIYKEIKQNGRSGQIESVQESTDFIDKLYKSSGFTKTRKSSANSNETRHGAKNSGVQRVGEISSSGRERSSSNGSRDSQSGSEDRQKYSRELDSLGNELSKEQKEYFKDSKVRDDNGNLLVVYHGTRKADFTVFKRNVNFFTDSSKMADSYSPNGEKFSGYLNITNPYVIDAKGERWSKIPIDQATKAFLDNSGSSTFKEGGKWRTTPADIASAIEDAIENGDADYDGIIIKNVDDTGSYSKDGKHIVANDYIAFSSKQFKNVDNKSPTSNPDIRYSREFSTEDIYTATSDFKREVAPEDQKDFPRKLANKTTGIPEGETRIVYVDGYIFEADGYMHGRVIAPYNQKTKKILKEKRNKYDGFGQDRESSHIWTKAVQNAERGSRSNTDISSGERATADDRLSGTSLERNTTRDNERVWKNPRTEEEYHEIINKVRVMYGLEPVDYGKEGKFSRELDFINFINNNTDGEEQKPLTNSELRKVLDEKIDSSKLIALADRQYDTYGGEVSKNKMRYAFLHAMNTMLEGTGEDSDRAYEEVVRIADELVYNPKIEGGVEEVLNQILIFSILMV